MANRVEVSSAGVVATASFTPVAEAYTAGDVVNVAKQFSWTFTSTGLEVPVGSTIRILTTELRIDATAVIASETSYTLHKYTRTPPSAQANNDAWTLASGDLPYYKGELALGTVVDKGAAVWVKTGGHNLDIELESTSVSTFGVLVTVGGPTLAAVARQVKLIGIVL